jgi:hypothetical protein
MHTDVGLDDSPSRQPVLEHELFRRPTVKIFQCSHAHFSFFYSRFALLVQTRMSLLPFLSLNLLLN